MNEAERGLNLLGWREWIPLTGLGEATVKVKVDTGARTSSLHAYDIVPFDRDGEQWVRFRFHPDHKNDSRELESEAKLIEHREVKSSSGEAEMRPVVEAEIRLWDEPLTIELTLTNRDAMGFRMLLGRHAIKKRFLIDPGRSYLAPESVAHRRRIKRKDNQPR